MALMTLFLRAVSVYVLELLTPTFGPSIRTASMVPQLRMPVEKLPRIPPLPVPDELSLMVTPATPQVIAVPPVEEEELIILWPLRSTVTAAVMFRQVPLAA